MKNFILLLGFSFAYSFYANGQTIRDDGKITQREKRFVSRKIYGSDRKIRLHEWKDSREVKKAKAKQERINDIRFKKVHANKKDWGTKKSRKDHAKHYAAMRKGWLYRDNPRQYVKETAYP